MLLVVVRGLPERVPLHLVWPDEPAGQLACVVLAGMGFLVPLAMMLGAF